MKIKSRNLIARFICTACRRGSLIGSVLLCLLGSIAISEEGDAVLVEQSLSAKIVVSPIVDVGLKGKTYPMFFDTGVGITILDSSFRTAMGAEVERGKLRMLGGFTSAATAYVGPTLKLGNLTLEKPEVILFDMQALSRFTGRPLAGMLGMNTVGKAKIFLNFERSVLQVHAGPWRLAAPDCQEVELNKESGIPEFDVRIGGHRVTFGIDTGFDGTFTLAAPLFEALVNDGTIELANVNARGATPGGVSSVARGWFLRGRVMGRDLAGLSVESDPAYSNVGMKWLYGFNTEIDFAARKFRYQVRCHIQPPISVQMMIACILIYDDKGALVERLRPGGGAAENAGLKPGDVIEEFGSLKAGEMNQATIGEMVAASADKEVAIRFLRKSDGSHVNTKLKLPPVISEWNFAGRDIFNGK